MEINTNHGPSIFEAIEDMKFAISRELPNVESGQTWKREIFKEMRNDKNENFIQAFGFLMATTAFPESGS